MKNVYAFLFLSMFLLMSVCVPGRAHAQVLAETGTTHFTVRIPVAVSWWTPAEKDWRGSLTGISGVRSGVELYPHGEGCTPEDGRFRLYGRALLGWRIGAGDQNTYGALYNAFSAEAGLFARLNVTRQHGLYAGCGAMWAAETYSFTPKHGAQRTETGRGAAVSLTAGYQFKTEGRLSLFVEAEYAHFLADSCLDVFMPGVGISFGL